MGMTPIQTKFRKVTYRSRLEARWAVFMHHLSIEFLYEAEGYDLDGVLYLPDFWLPQLDCFLEIKPFTPTDIEQDKAHRLAAGSGKRVYILFETPGNPYEKLSTYDGGYLYGANPNGTTYWDGRQWWCECPHCGLIDIEFDGRSDRIGCDCPKSAHGDKGYNADSHRLLEAYEIARTYRFY